MPRLVVLNKSKKDKPFSILEGFLVFLRISRCHFEINFDKKIAVASQQLFHLLKTEIRI